MNAYAWKAAELLVLAVLAFPDVVPAIAPHLQAGQMTRVGGAGRVRES